MWVNRECSRGSARGDGYNQREGKQGKVFSLEKSVGPFLDGVSDGLYLLGAPVGGQYTGCGDSCEYEGQDSGGKG